MALHLAVWGLLFSMYPYSAIGTLAGPADSSYIRLQRDGDPTGSDEPGDSDDPSDNEGDGSGSSSHRTKTTASSSATTATSNAATATKNASATGHSSAALPTSSTINTPSNDIGNANSFHKEGAVGIVFGIVILAVIVWLVVRARRKRAKEQGSSNTSSMAEKAQSHSVTTNRNLPPIPSSDSTSEINMRQQLAISSTSRLISGTEHVRLDDFGSLPNPFGSESDHPHLTRTRTLPATSNQRYPEELSTAERSDDTHRPSPQTRAAIRAQTLPTIRTQRNSEEQPTAERTSDDSFSGSSFLRSPSSSHSPQVHRSLIFSSALTAAANGHLASIPEPPPSPSAWISRSPAASRRNSTLYDDMKVYQKGLEAEAKGERVENEGGSSSQDPPPKYSVEEPRTSRS